MRRKMTGQEVRREIDRLAAVEADPLGEMLASPLMREMLGNAADVREAIALRILRGSATVAGKEKHKM